MTVDPDKLVTNAVEEAAGRLKLLEPRLSGKGRGGYINERDLQDALGCYLDRSVVERKFPPPGIPFWDPQPGNVDLWVNDQSGNPALVIETKLKDSNKIYECLWDMTKLLPLLTLDHVRAAYLVVGFLAMYWERPAECAELFEPGQHELVGSIEQHRKLWTKEILGDSSGFPLKVPERVEVKVLTRVGLPLWGYDCELRAIRIAPVGAWIQFIDGQPPLSDSDGSGRPNRV